MYLLTNAEFDKQVKPIYKQVFVEKLTCEEIFMPNVAIRRMAYPCSNLFDGTISVEALIAAALAIGDTGCYISAGSPPLNEPAHCYVPLSELQDGYAGEIGSEQLIGVKLGLNPYKSETKIFSATGRWGIFMNEDFIAFVGGSSQFFEVILEWVPDLDHQVYAYLEYLQELKADYGSGLTIDWLPQRLAHIYGQEAAQRMLQEARLP